MALHMRARLVRSTLELLMWFLTLCVSLPLLSACLSFSVDVLTAMGQRMFKVAYEAVTPAQRATAKSCVYATLYGAGPGKVAEDVSGRRSHQHSNGAGIFGLESQPRSAAICARSIVSRCLPLVATWARICCCCCQNNLSVSEATHFLGEFHRIFPTIRIAMDALTKKVAQDGYVKTLFERRRSVQTCERDPAFVVDAGWTSSALTLASLSTLRCVCLLLCLQHPPRCEWQRAVSCGCVPQGSQHSVSGQRC